MARIQSDDEDIEVWEEEVYPNCTVVILTEVMTGRKKTIWFDNTNPESCN